MTSSTSAKRTGLRFVSGAFVALTLTTGVLAVHASATPAGRAWGGKTFGTVVSVDNSKWGGAGTATTDGRAWGGAGTANPNGRAWG